SPAQLHGVIGFVADDFAVDVGVEMARLESGPDALNGMRSAWFAAENGGGRRLDRHDTEARFALFYHLTDPCDRPACPDARHENIGLSIGVAPDLFGGRLAVEFGVGRVVGLLGDIVFAVLR